MDNYSTPKPMKRVGDLFLKYKTKFKAPQATVEKACIEVIKKNTNFDILSEQVSYTVSTKTIHLNIPSLLKNEIKFKHQAILDDLKKELGSDVAPTRII